MHRKLFTIQRLAAMLAIGMVTLSQLACSDDTTTPDLTNNNDNTADVQDAQGFPELPTIEDVADISEQGSPDVVDSGPAVEDVAPDVREIYPDVASVPCSHPSEDPECPQGPFGPAAFITNLHVVEDDSCCHDYNNNGTYNNYLGELLHGVSGLPGMDVNANLQLAIDGGHMSYLLELSNMSNPVSDASVTLTVLMGQDVDDDFEDNFAGAGEFHVLPDSFQGFEEPRWRFPYARIYNGELLATGGRLDLRFPGLIDSVRISLTQVRLTADIVQDPRYQPEVTAGGRIWLTNGKIAGALIRDTLFESLNHATEICECLTPARPVYTLENDRWECNLTVAQSNACNGASTECRNLADRTVCNLLALQSNRPDVDTTFDGKPDAFSIGVTFEAVGASLVGMAP